MLQPTADLSEPVHNLDEPMGVPSPESDVDADLSIPFEDDFIQALDLHEHEHDDSDRIFTPPPHLAARFYRPSQTRRKGSAASSRRNSITSLQSLTSSHGVAQLAGGPQSKHVANHQRRDAILKDRQKRLSDRAAHVEKVRLRAARAKERTIALSEERALAAKQTRERNLKEIAAACAEEVKRAKAVAETTKGKREIELQKMRQQMEERQAEAERRREELKKQSPRARGSSLCTKKSTDGLPPVAEVKETEPKPLAEDAAVCRLQTWWRATTKRQAVHDFAQLGLTIDGVRDTPYDTVTELLSEQRVILTTAHILAICGLRKGAPRSIDQMRVVKSFLSAFLILGHPAQVLSNLYDLGDREPGSSSQQIPSDDLASPLVQELVGKAKDLLITFENILSRLSSHNNYTVPPALVETLPSVYASFESVFVNWKSRDSHALADGMLHQYVELDALLESVKESSELAVVEQYREAMAPNQMMLIARIKKLLGKDRGWKAIRDAVRQGRKTRAARKKEKQADMRPRIVEQSITAEAAMADLMADEQADKSRSTSPASTSTGAYPSPPSTPSVRPPKPKQGRLLPENRVVVHELAIDSKWRVCADDFLEAETKALKPVLDQMRNTMGEDPASRLAQFILLIKIAEHIRDKLQRLVQPHNPYHPVIGHLLDADQFKRTFQNGTFSYENFFASIGELLPKLNAPVRDEEVRDLVHNKLSQGSYVDRLEALILFIDVMLGDYANCLLMIVAPQLTDSAANYEAREFATAIEKGQHGLFAAEAAWRATRNKLVTEAARRDPENINHPKNRPTADRIYAHMLVGIFTQTSKIRYGQIPEMLQLDYKRILKYGNLTRNIVTAGGILLQCKNMLRRDVRTPWKTEAQRIMTVLDTAESEEVAVNGIMTVLEAGRSMPPAIKANLHAFVQKLIAAHWELATTSQPDPYAAWEPTAHDTTQPVLRLLLKRLRDHMTVRMTAASTSEKVKAISSAGEKLASSGLGEFVDHAREMIDLMTKVGNVDREAHGDWWETVAERVEAEANGAGSAAGAVSS